jgi:uncharacterized membrane protein
MILLLQTRGILLQTRGIGDLQTTVIILVLLLLVWVLLRQRGQNRPRRSFRSTSLGNLRKRYLQGEISEEEYEREKRDLMDGHKKK